MKRGNILGATIILMMLIWCIPVMAADTDTTTQTTTQVAATTDTTTVETGGIQPISPEKVQAKVTALENWAVALLAPIMHLMSKFALILAAILLLFAVFMRDILGKVFGIVACVVVGMIIFTNVGPITNAIQYLGQWLGQ